MVELEIDLMHGETCCVPCANEKAARLKASEIIQKGLVMEGVSARELAVVYPASSIVRLRVVETAAMEPYHID